MVTLCSNAATSICGEPMRSVQRREGRYVDRERVVLAAAIGSQKLAALDSAFRDPGRIRVGECPPLPGPAFATPLLERELVRRPPIGRG